MRKLSYNCLYYTGGDIFGDKSAVFCFINSCNAATLAPMHCTAKLLYFTPPIFCSLMLYIVSSDATAATLAEQNSIPLLLLLIHFAM